MLVERAGANIRATFNAAAGHGEGSLALFAVDVTLVGQIAQRLPDRGPADTEAFQQLRLGHGDRRIHRTVGDLGTEDLLDLPVEGYPGTGVQLLLGCGHGSSRRSEQINLL